MEAMASGLPVVTSPNSGTVARDGVEGYVAAYDDVDTLARRIRELAEDEGLRRDLGQAARRRAEHFNLDWYSGEVARLLRELCRERTAS
jgi:glycosyltransferase involved in cell wall biosynthesis